MGSKAYWAAREAEALKQYITEEKAYNRHVQQIYQEMQDRIQGEIDGFYGRYAQKEGITMVEAKKRVSKLDIAAYERKAARYVAERDFSKQANAEMRLYNLTMKVNRLEMLKANIGLELVAGHNDLQKYMAGVLKGRTLAEMKRQAGILGKALADPAAKVDALVHASFRHASFSDRIWMHQDILKAELAKLLQVGLIQGRNPRQLARELRKTIQTSTYNAERLMTTELSRVQTEAQKQSFEKNEFKEYEFIANGRCCEICAALDGKHFPVPKMMPGENAPPMHPNCRCSVAAYEDSAEYEAWLDYLDKGGTTAEWERLKSKKAVANSGGRGTIKSGAISGARNPFGEAASKHAEKYYGLVRSMITDVSKIARNTKCSEEEIREIKNYLFIDEHDLGDSGIKRFDPDYMIAESWQRLMENRAEKHDLVLIKYEIMEKELIKQGIPQDEAHRITSQTYNYGEEAKKFYAKIKKYRKE